MIEYPQYNDLDNKYIIKKLSDFYKEDIPNKDITSYFTISKDTTITAEIQADIVTRRLVSTNPA